MIRIGISGWRYDGWRGVIYPKGLAQRREPEFASHAVDSIEINGSHYALQTLRSYRAWYEATPAYFVFSVKGSRYLTHMLRFRDAGPTGWENGAAATSPPMRSGSRPSARARPRTARSVAASTTTRRSRRRSTHSA